MPIEVPAGLRFSCLQCGDCCTGWNVMLSAEERRRIDALPVMEGVQAGPRTVAMPNGRLRLARRPDGACVFLGERRQCLIHELYGAEAKPLACRLYPFAFTRRGPGFSADVSFSCRAVSEGHGAPIEEGVARWRELLEREHEVGDAPTSAPFSPRWKAAPERLAEVEGTLVGFLLDERWALLDRVRVALAYLRLATTGDPETPQASALRAALARALPAQILAQSPEGELDPTQRAVFRTWLYLLLNPLPPNFELRSDADRQQEAAARDAAFARFRDQEGPVWIDGAEQGFTAAEVARVGRGALGGRGASLVARFLAAKLVGQRYRIAGEAELSLTEAVPRLLLLLPVIAWTARVLALRAAATEVRETDVMAAVRQIDRMVGTLSLAPLDRASRDAFAFVLADTDLVILAALPLLV